MPVMPRIARAVPRGGITRPEPPGIPVLATLRWYDGRDTEVAAHAVGWAGPAVEIRWHAPGIGERTDWIPADDVRRPAAERPVDGRPRRPDSRGIRLRGGGMISPDL